MANDELLNETLRKLNIVRDAIKDHDFITRPTPNSILETFEGDKMAQMLAEAMAAIRENWL